MRERVERSGILERGRWVGITRGVVLVFPLSDGHLKHNMKTVRLSS